MNGSKKQKLTNQKKENKQGSANQILFAKHFTFHLKNVSTVLKNSESGTSLVSKSTQLLKLYLRKMAKIQDSQILGRLHDNDI